MISHSKKFVFVHIPKTAGTSITNVLDTHCEVKSANDPSCPFYYHASAIELKNFFDEMKWDWNEYFKFTFVRNPWDRLVSYYEFTKQRYEKLMNDKLLSTDLICKQFGEQVYSFEYFIFNLEKYAPNSDAYYHSVDGNAEMNFVGKIENLQHDFNHVCKTINIPISKLPHLQTTSRKHYSEYYTEITKSIVAERFSQDISMFGYVFSEPTPNKHKKQFFKYRYTEYKNEQKQKHFNAYNARKPNS